MVGFSLSNHLIAFFFFSQVYSADDDVFSFFSRLVEVIYFIQAIQETVDRGQECIIQLPLRLALTSRRGGCAALRGWYSR